jgi:peroxiredoxin
MKIIIILFLSIAVVIGILIFLKINSNSKNHFSEKVVQEFDMLTLSGDTITFPIERFSSKLILNFYSTDCSLCMLEIDDIISFSKLNNIEVLFVSADSLVLIKQFASDLNSQVVEDQTKISFGQVSLRDMNKLFGNVAVPQTILIDENLRIKGLKKGVVSTRFLQKSFE